MKTARIALIGDFDQGIIAHNAINQSVLLFNQGPDRLADTEWIGTETIAKNGHPILQNADGIWCAPGSPYRSMDGALHAIEFARTRLIPFLGTCGGYQHALLEFAHNVLGLREANHTESCPETRFPLLTRLSCALAETPDRVRLTAGSRLRAIYGGNETSLEKYNCRYGLNPDYTHLFKDAAMKLVAHSDPGEARGVELPDHPFFFGVAFQPERKSLEGSLHPLVESFFQAAINRAQNKGAPSPSKPSEITVRQAKATDTYSVVEILREAAHWVESTSRVMWRDSELIPSRLASDVEAGLIYLAEFNGDIAGTIKFQLEDKLFWPDIPPDESAFVHRLSVKRSYAGTGISTALLNWATMHAQQLGKRWLRLDCEAARPRLRAFYEKFGFEHHSDREVGPYFVSRYQMDVGRYAMRNQTVFK